MTDKKSIENIVIPPPIEDAEIFSADHMVEFNEVRAKAIEARVFEILVPGFRSNFTVRKSEHPKLSNEYSRKRS